MRALFVSPLSIDPGAEGRPLPSTGEQAKRPRFSAALDEETRGQRQRPSTKPAARIEPALEESDEARADLAATPTHPLLFTAFKEAAFGGRVLAASVEANAPPATRAGAAGVARPARGEARATTGVARPDEAAGTPTAPRSSAGELTEPTAAASAVPWASRPVVGDPARSSAPGAAPDAPPSPGRAPSQGGPPSPTPGGPSVSPGRTSPASAGRTPLATSTPALESAHAARGPLAGNPLLAAVSVRSARADVGSSGDERDEDATTTAVPAAQQPIVATPWPATVSRGTFAPSSPSPPAPEGSQEGVETPSLDATTTPASVSAEPPPPRGLEVAASVALDVAPAGPALDVPSEIPLPRSPDALGLPSAPTPRGATPARVAAQPGEPREPAPSPSALPGDPPSAERSAREPVDGATTAAALPSAPTETQREPLARPAPGRGESLEPAKALEGDATTPDASPLPKATAREAATSESGCEPPPGGTPAVATPIATTDPGLLAGSTVAASGASTDVNAVTTGKDLAPASPATDVAVAPTATSRVDRATLASAASGTIDVPELGRVVVHARAVGERVDVEVTADRDDGHAILRAHAAELTTDLRSAAIPVGRVTVEGPGASNAGGAGRPDATGAGQDGERGARREASEEDPADAPSEGAAAPGPGRVRIVL